MVTNKPEVVLTPPSGLTGPCHFKSLVMTDPDSLEPKRRSLTKYPSQQVNELRYLEPGVNATQRLEPDRAQLPRGSCVEYPEQRVADPTYIERRLPIKIVHHGPHDKRIAAVHHHVTRLRGLVIVQAGHESYRVLRRLTQLMDGRAQNL